MKKQDVSFIDAIGVDKRGNVVLSISGHIEWDATLQHIPVLRDKINSYLEFVESKQIYNGYPKAKGKAKIIEIISKLFPDKGG